MPAPAIVAAVGLTLLGLTLGAATPAAAAGPATQLRTQLDRFVTLLGNGDAGSGGGRRAAIRALAEEIFDFRETAKRVLGAHWTTLSEAEQTRFVHAFTDFIDRAYLRKAAANGGPPSIVIVQETVSGDDAIVSTQFGGDGDRTALEFRMLRADEQQWRAYDVRVGPLSLVGTYRAQFDKIIRDRSWDHLLARLGATAGAPSASR